MGMILDSRDASKLAAVFAVVRSGEHILQARQDITFHDQRCYKILDALEGIAVDDKEAVSMMRDFKAWAGL